MPKPCPYRALATRLGLRVHVSKTIPDYNWDGTGILRGAHTNYDLGHEIAHYLVATARQRALREFGLGTSPMAWEEAAEDPYINPYGIEESASILGIWVERRLSGRSAAEDTYLNHGWSGRTRSVRKITRELLRRQHLVWHHGQIWPRVLVRAPRKKDLWDANLAQNTHHRLRPVVVQRRRGDL